MKKIKSERAAVAGLGASKVSYCSSTGSIDINRRWQRRLPAGSHLCRLARLADECKMHGAQRGNATRAERMQSGIRRGEGNSDIS